MRSRCFSSMDVSDVVSDSAGGEAARRKSGTDTIFVLGPGNFLEVRKILPLLVEASPDHPSFHVVALSLPGFGFSEAPKKKGFGISQYAEVRIRA